MTMSLKELAQLDRNLTCIFADVSDEGLQSDGTVYVEGTDHFRGEFTMTDAGGKASTTQILKTGNASYMWSENEPGGIMIRLDEGDDSLVGNTQVTTNNVTAFEENKSFTFSCEEWTPDSAIFTPPAGREFIDFNAQLQQQLQKRTNARDQ